MQKKYRVAGYVKLAQKWEKREKQAREYNNAYYGGLQNSLMSLVIKVLIEDMLFIRAKEYSLSHTVNITDCRIGIQNV